MDKRYNKTLGIISENLFINECTRHNISVFKNQNDIGEIDYIIIEKRNILRVQVKSTNTKKRNSWLLSTKRSKNKLYDNIDYFACHIHDTNDWYLIPSKIVSTRLSISITENSNKYNNYKNNWNLSKEITNDLFTNNIEKRNEAINLYKSGISKGEIARRLSFHYSVINRWLREAGLGIRKVKVSEEELKKLYNSGKTMKNVATELGLTIWTTRKLFRKYNIQTRVVRYKSNKIKEL